MGTWGWLWTRAAPFALPLLMGGCQLFTTNSIGKGIGQKCVSQSECQGGECSEGVCTVSCSADPGDCPAPSTCVNKKCSLKQLSEACVSGDECGGGKCIDNLCTKECSVDAECGENATCASSFCAKKLKAFFVYVGVPEDEGWTLTHEQGRQYAMRKLPWLESDFIPNTFLPDPAKKAIESYIEKDYDVFFTTSFSLRNETSLEANMHPDKKFLGCSINIQGSNLGSYWGLMEQGHYLAGYAAALKTKTKRLGFLGSYVTPEVVRHINAYTLGAQSVDPTIQVEVRWVGFWFDTDKPDINNEYKETVLTKKLIASNCDVINHNMDNGRSVVAIEQEATKTGGKEVYSFGNDNGDACDKGPKSCLGTTYWNWGPLYVRLLEQIHRGTWDPKVVVEDPIGVDPETSIPNFKVIEPVAGHDIAIAAGQKRAELAAAGSSGKEFTGPYCTNGDQRMPRAKCLGVGEKPSVDELHTMCWFVKGVIELKNPDDPSLGDKEALVPPECLTQQ
jgi:basic membrane protein A and related proteins